MKQTFERIEKHLYRRQYRTAGGEWSTLYYASLRTTTMYMLDAVENFGGGLGAIQRPQKALKCLTWPNGENEREMIKMLRKLLSYSRGILVAVIGVESRNCRTSCSRRSFR